MTFDEVNFNTNVSSKSLFFIYVTEERHKTGLSYALILHLLEKEREEQRKKSQEKVRQFLAKHP